MANEPFYLSEKQKLKLAVEIVKILNGVSILQARHILDDAASLVMDCQLVDTENIRFLVGLGNSTIARAETGSHAGQ